MHRTARSTAGSDNVFADLGFSNADEMLAKSELVRYINRIIEDRGLTQVEAAKLLGVNQPKVSALKRGRLTDFSVERLMRFLVALGQEVGITVRPASHAAVKVAIHARRSTPLSFTPLAG
jgi:predicted XRE-type DNA-binding protein